MASTITLDGGEHARDARTSVMLRAHVFAADAGTQHRVLNLSATGLCIAQPGPLAITATVLVSIGAVDHAAAEVVWVRGGLAGLRFRRPIDVQAARRRLPDAVRTAPAAGWLAALDDAYHR